MLDFDEVIEVDENVSIANELSTGFHIVVVDDDVNTFEHVIECFVEILDHSEVQAEQCAMIIHDKGSCSVKNGILKDLIIMRDGLCDEGIDARIDKKQNG